MKNIILGACIGVAIVAYDRSTDTDRRNAWTNEQREVEIVKKGLEKAMKDPLYQACRPYREAKNIHREHSHAMSMLNFELNRYGPEKTEQQVRNILSRNPTSNNSYQERRKKTAALRIRNEQKYNQLKPWKIHIHNAYVTRAQLVMNTHHNLCHDAHIKTLKTLTPQQQAILMRFLF